MGGGGGATPFLPPPHPRQPFPLRGLREISILCNNNWLKLFSLSARLVNPNWQNYEGRFRMESELALSFGLLYLINVACYLQYNYYWQGIAPSSLPRHKKVEIKPTLGFHSFANKSVGKSKCALELFRKKAACNGGVTMWSNAGEIK